MATVKGVAKTKPAKPVKVKKSKKAARPKATRVVKRRPASRSLRSEVSAAAKRRQRARRPASSLELKIYTMLDELGIEYIKEHRISRCTVDIFIAPETVIELNGCYFHAHSCQKSFNAMQMKALRSDPKRYHILRKLGYAVALIWECEVEKDPAGVRKFLTALGKK